MKKELGDKLSLLSPEKIRSYYERLYNVLNDRQSCLIYAKMTNKDYASLPKDKVEIVEEKVYEEMFEGKALQPA